MATKRGGKTRLVKRHKYSLEIPCGLKVLSKSLYPATFRDKLIFRFYAEIKDGHQKLRENDFLRKVTSRHFRYPVGQKFCQNRSISLRFQNKLVFMFYAEIKDGRQMRRENEFGEKSPVEFADTTWVKSFVQITPSCSLSEINLFLRFYAEIQDIRQKRWENKVG